MKKEQMENIINRIPTIAEIYKYYSRTGYMVGRTVTGDLFIGNEWNMHYYKYSESEKERLLAEYEFNKRY